ncbi:methyltransferase-like protein 25 [Teleopsis dalmanni]|uniref:methyltransferase-like protein 25 n=1 Tax=Teleopsis dalmanni TaxID=139649 RepID=UPI0018CEA595|nr:methyltransferase-like protein 25 [Teleopsis dalmanni]
MLPATYTSPQAYFKSSLEFLSEYSWIYESANTCFIKDGILEIFPKEFVKYFLHINTNDLNIFPFVHHTSPAIEQESIQNFRKRLKRLIPEESFSNPCYPDITFAHIKTKFRKVNLKKQHEILRLGHLITTLCDDYRIIIDFGSGLGYLSEIVSVLKKDIHMLGLESDNCRVDEAKKRQLEFMFNTLDTISYKQETITCESKNFIEMETQEIIRRNELVEPIKMAIIGLHACGDLTITSIKLFLQMSEVKSLIIMPCCYHKMQMNTSTTFTNFPLSKTLKSEVKMNTRFSQILNRPFLRLACQQTGERWRQCTELEHSVHAIEMFERAVAEAILNPDGSEKIIKLKKKNKHNDNYKFNDFTKNFVVQLKETNKSLEWNHTHEHKFNEIIEKYPNGHKLAEGLTCLQTTLQKLCENIVLYDRLCYLEEEAAEQGLKINVRYEKIFNEKLSPRCYVLIAQKL